MLGSPLATLLGLDERTLLVRTGLVAAGGAFGSVARYLVGLATAEWLGATFPWGTLTVNVVGSFVIGLLATLADETGFIGRVPRIAGRWRAGWFHHLF
jgi:fluoride ion exporter CrcB/FEX